MFNALIWLMTALEVIVALLIIVLVLLQKSKSGGGLGGIAGGGGGATEEVFGAQTGNILTKSTVVLALFFLVNTLALTVFQRIDRESSTKVEELIESGTTPVPGLEDAAEEAAPPVLPSAPAPASEATEAAPEATEAAPEATEAAPEATEAAPEATEAAPETTP